MEQLKAFDKVLADAQEIKEKGNFLPDCSTKEGYQASKDFVLKTTTPARTALAKAHKEAKAFYLEGGRTVDAKKNELMAMLEEAQTPHQLAYKAVDDEKKRIKEAKETAIQDGFDLLNGYAQQALGQTSSFIDGLMDDCGSFDFDPDVFGKTLPEITAVQTKVMGQLTDAYTQALQLEQYEQKQKEMNDKLAAIEAKEQEQREAEEAQQREIDQAAQREQMRLEAEQAAAAETERLRLEAEQAKIDATNQAAQAETDRLAREEQVKAEAEQARAVAAEQAQKAAYDERQRVEREIAEKAAADKANAEALEANKKHSRAIKDQAFDSLVRGGMEPTQAKLAIKLIAARKALHLNITY